MVLARGCKLSMDGRGAGRDNVFVERLWRRVKYGACVDKGTKILEIDPRGDPSQVFGLGERPAKIAEGVLAALREAQP